MRVAIVFPHLPLKFEERTTYERSIQERYISARLNREEHRSFLCYLTHENSPFSLEEGDEQAHFFPIDTECRKKARKFFVSASLGRSLKVFRPDIVIFKGMGYYLPWWLLKKGFISEKIGFIVGGNPNDILLPIASPVYAEFESQLRGRFAKLARTGRSLFLGRYIPDDEFLYNEKKEYDIVSVGALSPLKNHRALIPLFRRYRIVIVGDGPELENLKKAAEGCGNVTFTGNLPREAVTGYIRKARLMVHPSRFEGFPRAFAESFASGVPVIALKRAIRGDFPQGTVGLLVEEKTLVDQVEGLLSDGAKLYNYSQNALELAENSYRGEIVYRQFLRGLEIAEGEERYFSSWWRRIFFPLRQLVWLIDYYYYFFGRQIKRRILPWIIKK